MNVNKLNAIIQYAPSATAGEVAQELQHRTFYTVQEALGAFSVDHETTADYSEAVEHLLARVDTDIANGQPEDIAQNNYMIKEW